MSFGDFLYQQLVKRFAELPPEAELAFLRDVRAWRSGPVPCADFTFADLTAQAADPRLRYAASILCSPSAIGRPSIDDDIALSAVSELIAKGEGINDAYRSIAKRIVANDPDGPKLNSIVRRLKKKRVAEKKW
jgi:hypothetical protein